MDAGRRAAVKRPSFPEGHDWPERRAGPWPRPDHHGRGRPDGQSQGRRDRPGRCPPGFPDPRRRLAVRGRRERRRHPGPGPGSGWVGPALRLVPVAPGVAGLVAGLVASAPGFGLGCCCLARMSDPVRHRFGESSGCVAGHPDRRWSRMVCPCCRVRRSGHWLRSGRWGFRRCFRCPCFHPDRRQIHRQIHRRHSTSRCPDRRCPNHRHPNHHQGHRSARCRRRHRWPPHRPTGRWSCWNCWNWTRCRRRCSA